MVMSLTQSQAYNSFSLEKTSFLEIHNELGDIQQIFSTIGQIQKNVKVSLSDGKFAPSVPKSAQEASKKFEQLNTVVDNFTDIRLKFKTGLTQIVPPIALNLTQSLSMESTIRFWTKESYAHTALALNKVKDRVLQAMDFCQTIAHNVETQKSDKDPTFDVNSLGHLLEKINDLQKEIISEMGEKSNVENGLRNLQATYLTEETPDDMSKENQVKYQVIAGAVEEFLFNVPKTIKETLSILTHTIYRIDSSKLKPVDEKVEEKKSTTLTEASTSAASCGDPKEIEGEVTDALVLNDLNAIDYILTIGRVIEGTLNSIAHIQPGRKVTFFNNQFRPTLPAWVDGGIDSLGKNKVLSFVKRGIEAGIRKLIIPSSSSKTALEIDAVKNHLINHIGYCKKKLIDEKLPSSDLKIIRELLAQIKTAFGETEQGFKNLAETYKSDAFKLGIITYQVEGFNKEINKAFMELETVLSKKESLDEGKREKLVTVQTPAPIQTQIVYGEYSSIPLLEVVAKA